ncbi:hypothetical protein ACVIRO_007625 [Rhizobium ruizarguesonis]
MLFFRDEGVQSGSPKSLYRGRPSLCLSISSFLVRNFEILYQRVAVFAAWLACLAVIGTFLRQFRRKTGFPALALLVTGGVIFTTFGWNRNLEIRGKGTVANTDHPLAESAFLEWLSNRPDLDSYADRPYPVFVATAEGGGL